MERLPENASIDELLAHQVLMVQDAALWEDDIENVIARGSYLEKRGRLKSLIEMRDHLEPVVAGLRAIPETVAYESEDPVLTASVLALFDHIERLLNVAIESAALLEEDLEDGQ